MSKANLNGKQYSDFIKNVVPFKKKFNMNKGWVNFINNQIKCSHEN